MFNNKVDLQSIFINDVLHFLKYPIFALETGYSWDWSYENIPYLSTYNISKYLVNPTKGYLYSLDINKNHIDLCSQNLKKYDLDKNVIFCNTESLHFKNDILINFLWLDSLEDNEHGLREYNKFKSLCRVPFCIAIDDYLSTNSVKWVDSSINLKHDSCFYKIYDTPTGLIIGYYNG